MFACAKYQSFRYHGNYFLSLSCSGPSLIRVYVTYVRAAPSCNNIPGCTRKASRRNLIQYERKAYSTINTISLHGLREYDEHHQVVVACSRVRMTSQHRPRFRMGVWGAHAPLFLPKFHFFNIKHLCPDGVA